MVFLIVYEIKIMKFYYFVGVCLLVVYIVLCEVGVKFDFIVVDFVKYFIVDGMDFYMILLCGYVFLLELVDGLCYIEVVVLL